MTEGLPEGSTRTDGDQGGKTCAVQCDVQLDWVTASAARARANMRKSTLVVFLAREGSHIVFVGQNKQKKTKFAFRVDELPFKVFGDAVASGKATVAVELEGGTIAHVLLTGADPVKLEKLLRTLAVLRSNPSMRPEDLGL